MLGKTHTCLFPSPCSLPKIAFRIEGNRCLHVTYLLSQQKQHQKADEYLRMIKEKLDVAVNQCIQAAGHEIEPGKQKQLLRVSEFISDVC